MPKVTRFGVSLDDDLLQKFDALLDTIGYSSRSEAIRDLIRNRLVEKEWEEESKIVIGILGLTFDHEARELTEKLTKIQHHNIEAIVSSTHIHLDHHNCLEVIILKGESGLIKRISDELISTRSVKHGKLLMMTTGSQIF